MYLLITLLLVTYVRTQQDLCSCSCCVGQFCIPVLLGTFNIQSCLTEICRSYCRNSYLQCQTDYPNGQLVAQCSSTVSPLYNCQCDCCSIGSALCSPVFVGYSTAYTCQPGACSISCSAQYPNQCVSNQNGQTNGTCIGAITTTTTTTTTTTSAITTTTVSGATTSWLGNTCSCMCCQSGPTCSPNIYVGDTSASQCLSTTCTEACQNRYPSFCPLISLLGQTNGTCRIQNTGNTRCRCQCCATNGCSSYEINTNGDCISCYSMCRQNLPCGNTNNVTESCESNKSMQFSVTLSMFTLITSLSFFSTLH